MKVPSLLKRWKRLKSGLDASSKAYDALNEHFKHKSEQWLKDDKCAQQDRQTSPSSMDIYDTVKEKGVWNILIIIHPWLTTVASSVSCYHSAAAY
jgi:hypothetical protein